MKSHRQTMRHTPSHRMSGFTLVELMLALTLGLIVIGALVGVFLSSSRSNRQNEAIAAMQDNARFALDSVSRDLAMAGYWGGVRSQDVADNLLVSSTAKGKVANSADGDCGPASTTDWLLDVANPIVFANHSLGVSGITALFSCLDADTLQANTDVLMIRRASGAELFATNSSGDKTPADRDVTAGRFYLKTDQNYATLFRAGTGAFAVATSPDCVGSTGTDRVCVNPVQVYSYTPQIYYVRKWLRAQNDGLPVLCRRFLDDSGTTPKMLEDCLADGVENLQVEWGVDNGTGLKYVSTPSAADLLSARTARVHIIVRSTDANVQGSGDTKTFTGIGDLADYSPTANTLRRAYSTTVQLKNIKPQ